MTADYEQLLNRRGDPTFRPSLQDALAIPPELRQLAREKGIDLQIGQVLTAELVMGGNKPSANVHIISYKIDRFGVGIDMEDRVRPEISLVEVGEVSRRLNLPLRPILETGRCSLLQFNLTAEQSERNEESK